LVPFKFKSDTDFIVLISADASSDRVDKTRMTISECIAKAVMDHNVPDLGIAGHTLSNKKKLVEETSRLSFVPTFVFDLNICWYVCVARWLRVCVFLYV
jgi:hypothetical protein